MKGMDGSFGAIRWARWCLLAGAAFLGLSRMLGCLGDCGDRVIVEGQLVDETSLAPVANAPVGGRSFTAGDETDYNPAFTSFGDLNGPPSGEDGVFRVGFSTGIVPCDPPPEFPRPDQVEVIVVRGECVFIFAIDINEETVVDMAFPDDVIKLRDAILVPACEPRDAG